MADTTRAHGRVVERPLTGRMLTIDAGLPSPISIYVPGQFQAAPDADYVIHFHGAAFVPFQAVDDLQQPTLGVSISLGAGSSRYEQPFNPPDAFPRLLSQIVETTGIAPKRIFLTSFSAGYGAVRAILTRHGDLVDGVLLLDSLHTGYIPDQWTLAEGGILDQKKLEPFVAFATRAQAGRRRMILTHSEVFPGTFASTTETADAVLHALEVKRTPLLLEGPQGMQQLSEGAAGLLLVRGYAGNTAPDHVDHLHALPALLPLLVK